MAAILSDSHSRTPSSFRLVIKPCFSVMLLDVWWHPMQNRGHAAVVENISKRREPLPSLSGIYFISPTESSITRLLDDFSKTPLYKTAHVFFSSKVSRNAIAAVKACTGLVPRLKTLTEARPDLCLQLSRCHFSCFPFITKRREETHKI